MDGTTAHTTASKTPAPTASSTPAVQGSQPSANGSTASANATPAGAPAGNHVVLAADSLEPAESHAADDSVIGCALPQAQIDAFTTAWNSVSGQTGKTPLGLWGSAEGDSGSIELHDLDTTQCDWRAAIESAPQSQFVQYVVVYFDAASDQSYVQPVGQNDQAIAGDFNTCLQAAQQVNDSLNPASASSTSTSAQGLAAAAGTAADASAGTTSSTSTFQCIRLQRDSSGKVTNL